MRPGEMLLRIIGRTARRWGWRGSLILACLTSLLCRQDSIQAQMLIAVNQLGYLPGGTKLAFLKERAHPTFEVIDAATHRPVFQGAIGTIGLQDASTGDATYRLDFTGLHTPGTYYLRLPGISLTSYEFRIDDDVYRSAALAALTSFYYQRCGTAVHNGTRWEHPPCHTRDAVFFEAPSRSKQVTGGWHDAGDYGKFVATAAVSTAFLILLYEHDPTKFVDGQLTIPEAHNGRPDLLDEVQWELQWLLTMQREDGGVYHKVSTKKWTGEYLPHHDPDTRYIFDVSSTATGAFAAVTAMGARVFARWDPPLAQRLLRASVHAWKFLTAHPALVPSGGFRNPPGVEGGEYGDAQDVDERLWASAELYRLTGNPDYHQYFLANYQRFNGWHGPLSWQNVQNMAYASYLHLADRSAHPAARAALRSSLKRHGDQLLSQIDKNGYRVVLRKEEYYWGSNSVALGYAFDLIQAYEATQQVRYLDGAFDQLHYLLGRNAVQTSFVTGLGANPVAHPYHQFSMMLGIGQPVPGLVVGGPNQYSRLHGQVLSPFPGKCYADDEKNYFVNEPAINYTAPFAFLTGFVSPLRNPTPERAVSKGSR